MVKNSIASKLTSLPTGHSDRIMSMRIPLPGKQNATLISVYAPTLLAESAVKERFYTELRSTLLTIPKAEKVIIMGDFNARVGRDAEAWNGVLGKHGVGNCNDNERLLFEFCSEQELCITNTIFQQKNSHKTTWMHPRSKHWHLIDYILVRQRDRKDILHTRVMPSAECHTDHRLVRCKASFHFKPKSKKGGAPRKKFNVFHLQSDMIRADFQENLKHHLEDSSCSDDPSPDELWNHLKAAINKSSEEVLGFSKR